MPREPPGAQADGQDGQHQWQKKNHKISDLDVV